LLSKNIKKHTHFYRVVSRFVYREEACERNVSMGVCCELRWESWKLTNYWWYDREEAGERNVKAARKPVD